MPKSSVVGRVREGDLLLAEALDVEVDASAQLGLDFVSFDHLNDLSLLLSGGRVLWANFPQILVNIVVE